MESDTSLQEIDAVLESARLRCAHRLRETLRDGAEPDRLDVLVVGLWRDGARVSAGRGPRQVLKDYGPHWGVGAGVAGVLIAAIEAAGRIFGS